MNKLRNYLADDRNHHFLIPIIAIILGFLLGTVIMWVTGEKPAVLYKSIVRGVLGINIDWIGTGKKVFTMRLVGEYFVYVMPIVLTGLSVAFAIRTGLFNIGAEGQLIMGALAAALIGVSFDLPKVILLPMVVLGGTLFGAIWGFIPGILKAKYNVHEVVVTIMLNYAALYIANYVLKQLPGSTTNETVELHQGALLKSDFLASITGNSRFHYGFVIIIIAIVLFIFIINRTTFGYELKAVGYNPFAALYSGMKVKRNAALSMTIAGAFSGLAGVVIVAGTFGNGRMVPTFENYGFDGIAVALIGGSTGLGSLLGGMLLAALKVAQPIMQVQGVPNTIATIISATIIVFVAMGHGIKVVLKSLKKKEVK